MKYELIFRDKAIFEMEDAFDYYEFKSKGLGKKFFDHIQNYFERIETAPKHFPQKYGTIREAFIQKFPFVILYEIHENVVVVYSVFHTSRAPKNKL